MNLNDIINRALANEVTISFSGEMDVSPTLHIEVRKDGLRATHKIYIGDLDRHPCLPLVIDRLIHDVTSATRSLTCELCGNKAPHLIPIFKQERGEFHKYNVCPECEYKHSQELAATRENFNRQFGEN